jgi:hypothetical protein
VVGNDKLKAQAQPLTGIQQFLTTVAHPPRAIATASTDNQQDGVTARTLGVQAELWMHGLPCITVQDDIQLAAILLNDVACVHSGCASLAMVLWCCMRARHSIQQLPAVYSTVRSSCEARLFAEQYAA